jgi:A/G-specific adenine glycosylase
MNSEDKIAFQNKIWNFYAAHKRVFSWRESINPYRITVSEIMLQQTQTARVATKFENWMTAFPTWHSLAEATELQVLQQWQGLGYNRRGLALYKIAKIVVEEYNSQLPQEPKVLVKFPQIGPNTAASICAFAFNKPVAFIETNIRTVFTHEFFPGKSNISDQELFPLIEATTDQENPREWYYALMDYGNHLKKSLKNINAASRHYSKQSNFKGSKREIRGFIIRQLTQNNQAGLDDLRHSIATALTHNKHDSSEIIAALVREGIVKCIDNTLFI